MTCVRDSSVNVTGKVLVLMELTAWWRTQTSNGLSYSRVENISLHRRTGMGQLTPCGDRKGGVGWGWGRWASCRR